MDHDNYFGQKKNCEGNGEGLGLQIQLSSLIEHTFESSKTFFS
jgi:hypothetical protein